jgi:hypothetical protein
MPSKKVKKQVVRFRDGMNKFVETFASIINADIGETKETSRTGVTKIITILKPKKNGMSLSDATTLGQKMAKDFHAWFSPTYYERYDVVAVTYNTAENVVIVEGRI